MEDLKTKTDISEETLKTVPEVISKDDAEKEEDISEAVSKISISKNEDDDLNLEERKKNVIKFLKTKKEYITYGLLALIVFIATYIRMLNVSKLKDVSTGTWTLGPDLDPFLFLRWAKYISENGSLFSIDMMRNFPLGHDTSLEMKLLSYMMVWFHKLLAFVPTSLLPGAPTEVTITYAAILFPVFMFALTVIAFFLFARKIFYIENSVVRNSIAIISTALFAVTPSLLPRTIAGIPEKESAAFFFIFMAFYFILESFTAKTLKKGLIFGVLSGIVTGILALIWGGATFVFMTIAGATLLAFILGKIDEKIIYSYTLWMISFCFIMMPFSGRYTLGALIASTSTASAIGVFGILLIDLILVKKDLFKINTKFLKKIKLPSPVISLIAAGIIIVIISSLFFGMSFIPNNVRSVVNSVIHPLDVSRFGLTVAENKQPFFINDWKNSFGPVAFNLPLYFWLFFVGSIVLFGKLIEKMKKEEKIVLIFGYTLFLLGLIFSKYSSASVLNGTSFLSFVVYFGGMLVFLGLFLRYYLIRYKKGTFDVFCKFSFSYILYFVILSMTIVGARGAVRLIMVLAAVCPIVVGFLIVKSAERFLNEKGESMKIFLGIFMVIVAIAGAFTFYAYYENDMNTAQNFAPSMYQWQWQNAMGWVRENTAENTVFAHWWDYGYWVQSLGERATILDGGNAITYWNHLMGRHVLTGPSEEDALEFLYSHNATHLLIDSSEIGKYTAYSSIGADENYDRFSWITSFSMDERQTTETSNFTKYVYVGGTATDEDIIWVDKNGREILLPGKKTGIGGIIVSLSDSGVAGQPIGVFIYNNQQYEIPLKNIFIAGKLIEFESGLDAGIFIYPSVNQANGDTNINRIGAAFYLSPRTIHSGIARWYLFGEESEYVKLAYLEPNAVAASLQSQGVLNNDFVYYQGFQGPIKIWEISYPDHMEINPEFLEKDYPNLEIKLAKTGEYN
jgi:asparagine N-glycosylation enzyme membrane subunit Stt3